MQRILKIWIVILFTLLAEGCGNDSVSSIPIFPVSFSFYPDHLDRELLSIGHKSFIEPRKAMERMGFGGILVVKSFDGINGLYYAYDLACPYEHNRNKLVEVDKSGAKAVCPHCGSEFEIVYGDQNQIGSGIPLKGPAKERLLRYQVISNGNGFRVVNL